MPPAGTNPPKHDEAAALREALAAEQRMVAELRAQLAAQEQSFRKLSHRLKNNLQLVISIVSLRLSALHDPASRHELEDMLAKIHALALVQKKLHDGGRLLAVEFDGFLGELTAALERPAGAGRVALDIAPVTVGIERAVPLGLIANELIALAGQSADQAPLTVRLARHDTRATLTIGPLPSAALEAQGRPDLGMPLVRALARQAQAELTIEPGPPASAIVSFPLDPPP